MKTTESQYAYIIQVKKNGSDKFEFHKRVEMYHMSDINLNIPLDQDFNFLEDVSSTLEFWNNQLMQTRKPLIMNNCELATNLFTFDNKSILENSSWFILPAIYFDKVVAIIGLIGSPISFNPYYYEMLQPFMILCSELMSE
ncbi:MAG: hypothetical protein ACW99A_20255 [Candidatus Kariarchaeaceae archaeon]|jgi:hypothetical protein